ncbi:MAG: heat-inducible transcriptional repressor HrcA [Acidobacteriota bacterium]
MLRQPDPQELDERSCNVLKTLIKEFIRVGQPVGSRRLSRIYREKLSPATLRTVMADLEEGGFLTHPHASAGRVPTAAGYRFYVEHLLGSKDLSPAESGAIRRSLEEERDPNEMMSKASQLLSTYTNNIGIVLAPPISRAVMKHIEFVRLSDERILVILVSRTGFVRHRLIRLESALTQEELNQASLYLTENFAGRNLLEIRRDLVRLMSQERALYDRLLRNVILLGSATLSRDDAADEEEPDVFLDGTSRVIHRLRDDDLDRLISLMETLERKSQLVKIIVACLSTEADRPSVTIGLEEHIPGMSNWTLITSPYQYDRHMTGTLGILGPSRMEYDRAISLVDYVAKLFGQLMEKN